MSPTQRTLKALREGGWIADVVERWNSHSRTRHDFAGFADIIAYGRSGTLAVQATSGSNVSARVKKLRDEPRAMAWASHPDRRLEVWGWTKHASAVDRKYWRPRIVRIDV